MAGRPYRPSLLLALGALVAACLFGIAACGGEDGQAPNGPSDTASGPHLGVVEGPKPLYLFGTIHVSDERVRDLPAVVTKAFEASDTVTTELALDEASRANANLLSMRLSLLEENDDFLAVVGPDLFRRVGALLPTNVPLANLPDRQPWFVWLLLMQAEALPYLEGGDPLDVMLYARAEAAGKELGALEAASDQLMLFSTLPLEDQTRMLEMAVTDLEAARKANRDPMAELIDLYVTGDENALLDAMNRAWDPADPVGRTLRVRLVDDRNVRMAEKIVAKRKAEPDATHFFAVGAGHLAGEKGIPALLRKEGLVVRRLVKGE